MSLSINGQDPIPAIQKSSKTTDGGAGNLGYFQQEKKKKDEKEKEKESDVFEFSNKENDDESSEEKLTKPNSIGSRIKTFWLSIHGIFSEVVDEKTNDSVSTQTK